MLWPEHFSQDDWPDEPTPVHVLPADGFEHDHSFDCLCDPKVEKTSMGTTIFIHNDLEVPSFVPVEWGAA